MRQPGPHLPAMQPLGKSLTYSGLQFPPEKERMPTSATLLSKVLYKHRVLCLKKQTILTQTEVTLKNVPNPLLAGISGHLLPRRP